MRSVLGAFVMLTGSSAVPLAHGRYHWRILDAAADAEQCRSSFEIVGRPHRE